MSDKKIQRFIWSIPKKCLYESEYEWISPEFFMTNENETKFVISRGEILCDHCLGDHIINYFYLEVIKCDNNSVLNVKLTLSVEDVDDICRRTKLVQGFFKNKDTLPLFCLPLPFEFSVKENENMTVICEIENLKIKETSPTDLDHLSIENTKIAKQPDSIYELVLLDESLSDIKLLLGEKVYPAHKVILAVNSPVFHKMFSHQMKENLKKEVEIKEMEEDVLKELLKYIYTRKVDKLPELAQDLLIAANRYEIEELKCICERELVKKIALNNVFNYLMLADSHNGFSLKKHCFTFIMKNFHQLDKLDGFEDLEKGYPNLLVELYREMSSKCEVKLK